MSDNPYIKQENYSHKKFILCVKLLFGLALAAMSCIVWMKTDGAIGGGWGTIAGIYVLAVCMNTDE